MSDTYPIELIQKNLNQEGYELKRKGSEAFVKVGNMEVKISASLGRINSDGIETLSSALARKLGGTKSDIASRLIKKPNFYLGDFKKLSNVLLGIFTAGLIFFGLERLNITGFILSNLTNSTSAVGKISNSTADIGIVVCILAIIGLLIWKLKK